MLDLSYNDVLIASGDSKLHPFGFKYVLVTLKKGDVMDNPASTKHRIHGPGIWLWEIHPSGTTAREYDSLGGVPLELREGAATLVCG